MNKFLIRATPLLMVALVLAACATSPTVIQTSAQNAVADTTAVAQAAVSIAGTVASAVTAVVTGPVAILAGAAAKVQTVVGAF